MAKHRIIANPAAGGGSAERAISKVESLLNKYGLDFDLVQSDHPRHADELAKEAAGAGYDVVVAAGGDGTVNEVLNGLMEAKAETADSCAMGVLCIGRGNDFAYGMGIPHGLEEGCRALAQGDRRAIDVGRVIGGRYPQGRYFGNCVGIGFDAVGSRVASQMTLLSGFPSYIVAVLKTIFLYYKAPLTTVAYDGRILTQPSLMISVMNGRRLGGGFMMAPMAEPDDVLFDLCMAHEVNRARIFALIPHFVLGTQATQKSIETARAVHVVVSAVEGSLPAHVDGEVLCTEGQRLEIELLPREIEVVYRPPDGES